MDAATVAEGLRSRVFGRAQHRVIVEGDVGSLDLLTVNKRKAYNCRIFKDDECSRMPSSKLKRSLTAGQTVLQGEFDKSPDLAQKLSLRSRR